jgi:hypothetical protein
MTSDILPGLASSRSHKVFNANLAFEIVHFGCSSPL